MDICPSCGARVSRGALLCPDCGKPLRRDSMDLSPPQVGTPLGPYGPSDDDDEDDFSGGGRAGVVRRLDDSNDWEVEMPAEPATPRAPKREPAPRPRPVPPPQARRPERERRPAAAPPAPRYEPPPPPAPAPIGPVVRRQATADFEGLDVSRLRATSGVCLLQIYGKDRQGGVRGWHTYRHVDGRGQKVGSGERNEQFPELETLAPRHFRVTPTGGSKVTIEDLGGINGVYRKIRKPAPLGDGTRFRVGRYLIDFRTTGREPEAATKVKDGERLSCADLIVPARLEFVRPDGLPGLSFPLTKSVTVIGQEREGDGPAPDIHLPADLTSGRHARVVRGRHGLYHLENLSEKFGTFVKMEGIETIQIGDEFIAGDVLFRLFSPSD